MKNKEQTTNKLIKNHKQQLFNRIIFYRYKTGIINNYDINFIAPNRQNKGYNFCGLVVYYQTPNKRPALIFDLINFNNFGVDLSANIETSKPPGILKFLPSLIRRMLWIKNFYAWAKFFKLEVLPMNND